MRGTELPQHDVEVLRRLAGRKAEIAGDPVNLGRKAAWYAHDAGEGARPMVLAELGGVCDAHPPVPQDLLECEHPWTRRLERSLRIGIYQFDVLRDDHVVEPYVNTNWRLEVSDYGVQAKVHHSDADVTLDARSWEAPIRDLDRDFHKLHPRTATVDREATLAEKARLEAVFDGILPVRIRGGFWWTMGMTWPAIDLIGLEGLMLFMYDDPDGLHRLMAFLRDDHLAFARWAEGQGLLSLNNENDYIGSGSMGYTRDLPQPGRGAGEPVRLKDQWVLLESQETVGVGPEQFQEFIFPYQLSLAEQFGKCYYGCCEPVHSRWKVLERIGNLARVSVSPWADEEYLAGELGPRFIYSRKPNPTLISTRRFDEDAIRADIRHTLEVTAASACRVEIIMKDVHTLNDEPDRLARWVRIAREEIDRAS
jgi:hypothetical protein